MAKRGRESLDTTSTTSRPPSRLLRADSPTGSTGSADSKPPEPPVCPVFTSAEYRPDEDVRARAPEFLTQSSSSRFPSVPHYDHLPTLPHANAMAYRMGMEPSTSASATAEQAAALAGLMVPILNPQAAGRASIPVAVGNPPGPATAQVSTPGGPLPIPSAMAPTSAPASTPAPPPVATPGSGITSTSKGSSRRGNVAAAMASGGRSCTRPAAPPPAGLNPATPPPAGLNPATPSPAGPRVQSPALNDAFRNHRASTESLVRHLESLCSPVDRVSSIVTIGLTLLFQLFHGDITEQAMLKEGWSTEYWSNMMAERPPGFRNAHSSMVRFMSDNWFAKEEPYASLRASVYRGDFPISELRQQHLDASSFYASTCWDTGLSIDFADIVKNCLMTFSSQIGAPTRTHLPQFLHNVIATVSELLNGKVPTGRGYPASKMLPFVFEQVAAQVLWRDVIQPNVYQICSILDQPTSNLITLGLDQMGWPGVHPDYQGRLDGLTYEMEGDRAFETLWTSTAVHCILGEDEIHAALKGGKRRFPDGWKLAPNAAANEILHQLGQAVDDPSGLSIPDVAGLKGFGILKSGTWTSLILHFRGGMLRQVFKLRRHLFLVTFPQARAYTAVVLPRLNEWVWGMRDLDCVERWLITAVADTHMLILARLLIHGLDPEKKKAALLPGSPIWRTLSSYQKAVHVGVQESVQHWCHSPTYALEYTDLRAELLADVEVLLRKANYPVGESILAWTRELIEDPSQMANRMAPNPGFAHSLSAGQKAKLAAFYKDLVHNTTHHLGVEDDLLQAVLEDLKQKEEAVRRQAEAAAAGKAEAESARGAARQQAAQAVATEMSRPSTPAASGLHHAS